MLRLPVVLRVHICAWLDDLAFYQLVAAICAVDASWWIALPDELEPHQRARWECYFEHMTPIIGCSTPHQSLSPLFIANVNGVTSARWRLVLYDDLLVRLPMECARDSHHPCFDRSWCCTTADAARERMACQRSHIVKTVLPEIVLGPDTTPMFFMQSIRARHWRALAHASVDLSLALQPPPESIEAPMLAVRHMRHLRVCVFREWILFHDAERPCWIDFCNIRSRGIQTPAIADELFATTMHLPAFATGSSVRALVLDQRHESTRLSFTRLFFLPFRERLTLRVARYPSELSVAAMLRTARQVRGDQPFTFRLEVYCRDLLRTSFTLRVCDNRASLCAFPLTEHRVCEWYIANT